MLPHAALSASSPLPPMHPSPLYIQTCKWPPQFQLPLPPPLPAPPPRQQPQQGLHRAAPPARPPTSNAASQLRLPSS